MYLSVRLSEIIWQGICNASQFQNLSLFLFILKCLCFIYFPKQRHPIIVHQFDGSHSMIWESQLCLKFEYILGLFMSLLLFIQQDKSKIFNKNTYYFDAFATMKEFKCAPRRRIVIIIDESKNSVEMITS